MTINIDGHPRHAARHCEVEKDISFLFTSPLLGHTFSDDTTIMIGRDFLKLTSLRFHFSTTCSCKSQQNCSGMKVVRIENRTVSPADDDVGGNVEEEEPAEGAHPTEQLAHHGLTDLREL